MSGNEQQAFNEGPPGRVPMDSGERFMATTCVMVSEGVGAGGLTLHPHLLASPQQLDLPVCSQSWMEHGPGKRGPRR